MSVGAGSIKRAAKAVKEGKKADALSAVEVQTTETADVGMTGGNGTDENVEAAGKAVGEDAKKTVKSTKTARKPESEKSDAVGKKAGKGEKTTKKTSAKPQKAAEAEIAEKESLGEAAEKPAVKTLKKAKAEKQSGKGADKGNKPGAETKKGKARNIISEEVTPEAKITESTEQYRTYGIGQQLPVHLL